MAKRKRTAPSDQSMKGRSRGKRAKRVGPEPVETGEYERELEVAAPDSDAPRGPGRPPKFNRAAAIKIINAVGHFAYEHQAAVAAGVSPRTLRLWKRAGRRDPGSEFGSFFRTLDKVTAEAENKLASFVGKASLRDPYLALKLMALKYRDRWNPRVQMEITERTERPKSKSRSLLRHATDEELAEMEEMNRGLQERAAKAKAAAGGKGKVG